MTWQRKETILRSKFIDDVHGIKHLLARLIGFDGAYMRFTGELTIQRSDGDRVVETVKDEAIWEEMYFGRTHEN